MQQVVTCCGQEPLLRAYDAEGAKPLVGAAEADRADRDCCAMMRHDLA